MHFPPTHHSVTTDVNQFQWKTTSLTCKFASCMHSLLVHAYRKVVCVCVCVCTCTHVHVCKQSYYPEPHNEMVSHINSGKSLDNYVGLSLHLSYLPSVLFLFLFCLFFQGLFIFFFFNVIPPHPSSSSQIVFSVCKTANGISELLHCGCV